MRMRFGSTCEGSNEPTFWGGSFQKTVGAALFLVAVSGLLCSCVHTYCTRGCDSADEPHAWNGYAKFIHVYKQERLTANHSHSA